MTTKQHTLDVHVLDTISMDDKMILPLLDVIKAYIRGLKRVVVSVISFDDTSRVNIKNHIQRIFP